MAVSGWIADLARRLSQLDGIAGMDNLGNIEVWLGGLFYPEAYITATRQAVAHRKQWSLETLSLRLDIERVNDPSAYIVDGEFATVTHYDKQKLILPQVLSLKVPLGKQIDWPSTVGKLCDLIPPKYDGYRPKSRKLISSICRSISTMIVVMYYSQSIYHSMPARELLLRQGRSV